MQSRTQTSRMTFRRPFHLPGDAAPQPAGDYDLTVDEDMIDGLSFDAWRRTGMWLTIRDRGAQAGHVEMRPITDLDLAQIVAEGDATDPTDPSITPKATLTTGPCPT